MRAFEVAVTLLASLSFVAFRRNFRYILGGWMAMFLSWRLPLWGTPSNQSDHPN
jgi:hypothetical protein